MIITKRKRFVWLSCFSFIAFFVLVSIPTRVWYHRFQFAVSNYYLTNGLPFVTSNSDYDMSVVVPQRDYHLKKLVELGAIVTFEHQMTTIANNSPFRAALIRKLHAGDCPDFLYWSSVMLDDSNPMVLNVWCDLEDKEKWEQYLNRENYLEEPEQSDRPESPTGRFPNG